MKHDLRNIKRLDPPRRDPAIIKIRSKNKLKGIKKVINWENIRVLGNLKLLTKASYLVLIFIPLLAATWNPIAQVLDRNLHMPSIWGWSFIAAFLVITGHLIYEVFSPTEIKKHSRDQYVVNELALLGMVSNDLKKQDWELEKEKLTQFELALESYNKQSVSGWLGIVLSGLLYITSLTIIIFIVYSQLLFVLKEAGGCTEMLLWFKHWC